MPKYIDKDKMIQDIKDNYVIYGYEDFLNDFFKMVEEQPTVDAEPVRHGHWHITDAYPHNVYCSECHTRFAQTHWTVWEDGSLPRSYCPNCGARMDEEDV